jgi:hypothetical protein
VNIFLLRLCRNYFSAYSFAASLPPHKTCLCGSKDEFLCGKAACRNAVAATKNIYTYTLFSVFILRRTCVFCAANLHVHFCREINQTQRITKTSTFNQSTSGQDFVENSSC